MIRPSPTHLFFTSLLHYFFLVITHKRQVTLAPAIAFSQAYRAFSGDCQGTGGIARDHAFEALMRFPRFVLVAVGTAWNRAYLQRVCESTASGDFSSPHSVAPRE